jgi:hypothetical protein
MVFFSWFYGFSYFSNVTAVVSASTVAAFVEALSPMGFDNLAVPAFSVLTFLFFGGGA